MVKDDSAEQKAEAPYDGWFDRNQMRVLKLSVIAVFLMLVLGGIFIVHSIQVATQRADDNARAVTLLSKNLDTSRKQLTEHGITPSAPPAKTVVEQVDGAPGATGAAGRNGAQGEPGPSGPPGPSGKPGVQGSPGTDGQTGAPGVNGTDGIDGKDGAQGEQGVPGPAGPAGQDGKDGTNGTNGKDGVPPVSWTYTDPAGVAYTCSRVTDFDPSAPRYTCAPDAVSTPPPSDTGFLASSRSSSPSRRQEMPMMMSVAYAIVSERKRL